MRTRRSSEEKKVVIESPNRKKREKTDSGSINHLREPATSS